MTRLRHIVFMGMAACCMQGHAQSLQPRRARLSLDEFRREVRDDLKSFRRQCMDDFISFVQNPWKEFEETPPVPAPKDDTVPPVVMPDDDKDKPVEDHPVVIDDVIAPPEPEPQPQPVEPIREVPVVNQEKYVTFTFFGTQGRVRCDAGHCPRLNAVTGAEVADGLLKLTAEEFDNTIVDCLLLRDSLALSDWAYLQMLQQLGWAAAGKGTNGATLLTAYLYLQSGYKMRLATDDAQLYLLYATKHQIFEQGCYELDGERYYSTCELPGRLSICQAAFPKEKRLSLVLSQRQRLASAPAAGRTLRSAAFADISLTTSVNKNLIAFYNTYPTSMLDNNMMTRWAMYANTPLDAQVERQVSASLKDKLNGLSQKDAVERLLNLVQTGLEYEYDNKVWGQDRAFFSEESLYYPYADCEDRAILLSRLVRSLLGLKCILVFYPGHLAMAVAFTEDVKGDYIELDGKRFVVCDPTYIGAPVGKTMPGMSNTSAKVILLL